MAEEPRDSPNAQEAIAGVASYSLEERAHAQTLARKYLVEINVATRRGCYSGRWQHRMPDTRTSLCGLSAYNTLVKNLYILARL